MSCSIGECLIPWTSRQCNAHAHDKYIIAREHSRIGFAESSCSYDKTDIPKVADDSGYASDCQVKEPILSKPCVESVDKPLCRFNQSNIALLGTEKWAAVVKNPGTRLGVTCVAAAEQMKVKDLYSDPVVSCDSKGICEEERPCQMTCQQVANAARIVQVPRESTQLRCDDAQWSACDRSCSQTRLFSAPFSDGKCHEIKREIRRCHIGACAREDPCRAPYSVRIVLGLRGVDLAQWSEFSEATIAEAVTSVLGGVDKRSNVLPGDVNVQMARSWFPDEDDPDATTSRNTDLSLHQTKPHGVKAIVDVAVANNRTSGNISSLEDDSDFEDNWKILGNLSQHIVGQLREVRCYDDDLFVLAKRALAIKRAVSEEKSFILGLVQLLRERNDNLSSNIFASAPLLNESIVVTAWSFRNGVDDKVNYLGPRKPWYARDTMFLFPVDHRTHVSSFFNVRFSRWFGIFRAVHFATVLVTSSLVLWSLFGVIQNLYENGLDCGWFDYRLKIWPKPRNRNSFISHESEDSSHKDGGVDEGVTLVAKGRESHRHGSTSPKKRRAGRIAESLSF